MKKKNKPLFNTCRKTAIFGAYLLPLLLSFLFSVQIFAQKRNDKKEIQHRKETIRSCPVFTCISEIDSSIQKDLSTKNKRMFQIYLIRHAKPDISKKTFSNSSKTTIYKNSYNTVAIQPFNPDLIHLQLTQSHIIQHSPLRRSRETAQQIFKSDYSYSEDSVYREFETRIIKAPDFLVLPTSFWQGLSRFIWMLGGNDKGIESHKEAIKRATLAANKLITVAEKEETAILVAHGMLNRSIKKSLHKKGWKVIQNKGKKNLGATILVKVNRER